MLLPKTSWALATMPGCRDSSISMRQMQDRGSVDEPKKRMSFGSINVAAVAM